MIMTLQYRYAQFIQKNGSVGYASFAFNKKIEVKDDGQFEYVLGMSFCSPKDSFIKSIGRAKAEHRLSGKRTRKPIVGVVNVDKTRNSLSNKDFWTILDNAIANNEGEFPRWALKSWKNGLVVLTTTPLHISNVELEKTDKARYLKSRL